jgi:hypothetical protein
MKNKRLILVLIILIFSLSISICSSKEVTENSPDNIILEDENIPWLSNTYILTPFSDKAQVELICHIHVPKYSRWSGDFSINQAGTLISEIVFYVADEKKDFAEFFLLEIDEKEFRMKPIKKINLSESSDLKFKFYIIPLSELLSIDGNTTTTSYQSDFYLQKDHLFYKYIFRVPTVNAHNIRLDFQDSALLLPDQTHILLPLSKVYETDEYLEITYIFWNDELVNQILRLEEKKLLTRLRPDATYIFRTKFSIEYETFREEWLIAIVLSSIVAILAFVGGALWGKG